MHDSTYPNEHIQVLLYYEFAVNLDRCVESYNTINVLSNTVCVQNKTGDLNFIVFNMTTGINESKTLRNIYHGNVNISLMAKNMTQIYVSIKIQENVICAKETFFWNSATCSCQKQSQRKLLQQKMLQLSFIFYFVFFLITIALLIAASICLIKHQSKQKKYYHITSQIAN